MGSQAEVVALLKDDSGLEKGVRRRNSIRQPENTLARRERSSAKYDSAESMRIRSFWAKLEDRVYSTTSMLEFLLILLPSYLQPSYKYNSKLYPTSWLDGLRGYAALSVYILHFINPWWPSITAGFASGPGLYNFIQLPIIRIVYSGGGMVSVFFAISGYVLSYNSLRRIRDGDWTGFLEVLVSSVFRRWLRLHIPVLVSTFIAMLISRGGWWATLGALGGPSPTGSFFTQTHDWAWHFIAISSPIYCSDGESVHHNPYGPQLWTIPREFRGSMSLYLVLLGLAKTREVVRTCFLAFFCWYTLWCQQWDLFLFLFGMLLAGLQLLRQDRFPDDDYKSIERYIPSLIYHHSNAIMHTLSIILALLAIHLVSLPTTNPRDSPGYMSFVAYTPARYASNNMTHRYWSSIGAALLLTAILLSPPLKAQVQPLLQQPFRTRFAQYLGNISFSLYVTHFYVLGTIGSRIFVYYGTGTAEMKLYSFFVAILVNTFLCFWIADLFWRSVDTKTVLLAKLFAAKCFVKTCETRS